MRYERKFPFQTSNLELMKAQIIQYGFFEAYKNRSVTSVYYDTQDFYLYNISEYGIENREKKRIRWYNNSDDMQIEYKQKKSELGNKFIKEKNLNDCELINLNLVGINDIKMLSKKIPSKLDSIYFPNVGVSYKRKYLESICKRVRITMDYDISFSRVFKTKENLSIQNWIPSENAVLEIKYESNILNVDLLINKFIVDFDLQFNRFSKYCQAVKICY